MSKSSFLKYRQLLTYLFELRALGTISDEMEAVIAEKLNDCRAEMTESEEAQIPSLIAEFIQYL